MPGKKNSNVKITAPKENGSVPKLDPSTPVTLIATGISEEVGANAQTSVFARVFYRANGIPFVFDLYNDLTVVDATPTPANGGTPAFKGFQLNSGSVKQFTPVVAGDHSITFLAWDSSGPTPKSKIDRFEQIRQKKHRFRTV
jgi:hypothetical protein